MKLNEPLTPRVELEDKPL